MTEPRTEAGRRLLASDYLYPGDALRDAILAIETEAAALPAEFVGFLVGEFMRAGFHKGPRAAQADARHIVERWNSRSLAKTAE